ncbi:MAG: crossover junction endodeoxyribonuclease RuvC [Firmicutes bacterium]|nr:crossover junction endodeoxyribonuclease RuvC [Bacillota bacterium]
MRILGIDPGYALMGYGVIEKKGNRFSVVDYGSIATDAGSPMPERLKYLYTSLMDVIAETQPDAAAIEELFYNTNAKTVINVGQARGVAVLACVNSGLKISEYTPLQIKQALVGYGRAEKKQVQQMVKALLGLSAVPKPDDTADALAVAICHGNSAVSNSRVSEAIQRAIEKEDRLRGKKAPAKPDGFRIIK